MELGWEAWATIGVMVGVVVLLAITRVAPEMILLGGLTLLVTVGVLEPADALVGMSNEGMVTVGVLFVVAAAVRNTGAMEAAARATLGRPRTTVGALLRLLPPVMLGSAFLNNTPLVALLIPTVGDWARRHGIAVSKLMIPLSYAAILGGLCTLVGTSTNLVVNGLWMSELGRPSLGMFEITMVGLPAALVGGLYLLTVGRRLLPERDDALHRPQDPREYTVEMRVEEGSPLSGRTIEQAGLRGLRGLYLLEMHRGGRILPAVEPTTVLADGDQLVFVGTVDQVVELQRMRGLIPATDQVFRLNGHPSERRLFEAVVSYSCRLVGRSIRDGRFRTVFGAAVIAVARDGERVRGKVGDIVLRPGDTLLVEAHSSFAERLRDVSDFHLVSLIEGSEHPRHDRMWVSFAVLGALVLVVALGWMSMLQAAALAAAALLLTGCIGAAGARRSVDWQVLLVIIAAFGIGRAAQTSGAAAAIAESLVGLVGDSPWAVLVVVYGVTSLFTELLTNNGAAVLVFPIAVASAQRLGVDPHPYVIGVMMAASASFATPIGYQTNMMVYGPGGYRFVDFLRVGIPMNLLMGITSLLLIPLIWGF